MKSTKTVSKCVEQTCSTMVYLEGQEVKVCLDWDSRRFYVWMEPSWVFEDFCNDYGHEDSLNDLRADLEKIGVHEFVTLDSVNAFCKQYCGDNEPASFYYDEWGNVDGV